MSRKWKERLTQEERAQVTRELKDFGLTDYQIESLMNYRGRISMLVLQIMRDSPPLRMRIRGREVWRKPSVHMVVATIRDCQKLGLITVPCKRGE